MGRIAGRKAQAIRSKGEVRDREPPTRLVCRISRCFVCLIVSIAQVIILNNVVWHVLSLMMRGELHDLKGVARRAHREPGSVYWSLRTTLRALWQGSKLWVQPLVMISGLPRHAQHRQNTLPSPKLACPTSQTPSALQYWRLCIVELILSRGPQDDS